MSDQENLFPNTIESMKYALGGVAGIELFATIAHAGLPGMIALGIGAGYVAYKHGPQTVGYMQRNFISPLQLEKRKFERRGGNGSEIVQDVDEYEVLVDEQVAEDEMLSPRGRTSPFSTYLTTFTPSLKTIYLASLPDGTPIYADAKGLCHVAIAGATGNGKGVIIRLLMSQLCMAGASVLLLNPHYTRYDLEHNEDWTPFEPYLVYDPMECRKYDVIEHYLNYTATVLLPKRLEKYAHSQPLGKPYFLVLDELPAIIDNIPDAPKYLAKILREGRKVGIFLITAAQDFLVKTIAPQGGGAIRDCYRTAFYVGGDPITAKVLLDMPANQIQEDALGKGTVMLRNLTVKQAAMAHIPYVDNKALYQLLGPSTYVPGARTSEDEMPLEDLQQPVQAEQFTVPAPSPEIRASGQIERPTSRHTAVLTPDLQMALNEYRPGMSHRDLARVLGVSHPTAGKYLQRLKDMRMIDVNGHIVGKW